MSDMSIGARFETAMREIYDRAATECGYRPTYFLRMVEEQGGVEAAHSLLRKQKVSEGFTKLAMLGRLDLSVESLVLDPRWSELFSEDELKVARRRLR